MNLPLISVIIPLFNKAATIEHSIESVLTQSFKEFELIIVNDGSTDNSMEIVKKIHNDSITLVEQENGGPSKARNTGIRIARGKWIVFLDADDEFLPNALLNFWESHLKHEDADVIDFGLILRGKKEERKRLHKNEGYINNNFKEWFYGELMPGSGHSMFKAKLFEDNLYNEKIRRYEDAELIFRILNTAKVYKELSPSFIVNTAFSSASNARKNIQEDFAGHLYLKGLPFWQKMCIYKFFIEERDNYASIMRSFYPDFYQRYDLNIIYHILKLFT